MGVVVRLLDVEKVPRKPIYELADESGLVLRDCGFRDLPFAPTSPPPPAGSIGNPGGLAVASAVESLRQSRAQALRTAAVLGCLADAAGSAATPQLADVGGTSKRGAPRHTPLLQRAVGHSFEEKMSAFEAKKRRKDSTESAVGAEQRQPAE